MAKTLLQKLWETHVVRHDPDGSAVLYIDLHLINEVTSPQAFEGLSVAGLSPWRSATIIATSDHNVPTKDLDVGIQDPVAKFRFRHWNATVMNWICATSGWVKKGRGFCTSSRLN